MLTDSLKGNEIWQDLGILCDNFLSSVTEGLQPNAEESGTGLQEASHGAAGRHTHTRTHTQPFYCLSTNCMHQLNFGIFIYDKYYLLTQFNVGQCLINLKKTAAVLYSALFWSRIIRWVCLKDLVNCHQYENKACFFHLDSWQAAFLEVQVRVWHLFRINLCCVWGGISH